MASFSSRYAQSVSVDGPFVLLKTAGVGPALRALTWQYLARSLGGNLSRLASVADPAQREVDDTSNHESDVEREVGALQGAGDRPDEEPYP